MTSRLGIIPSTVNIDPLKKGKARASPSCHEIRPPEIFVARLNFPNLPLATADTIYYLTNMFTPAPIPAQPLAGLLADLRTQADDQATRFGPVARLHALILAVIVRLLTGFEQIFEQWRAGVLPLPAPREIPCGDKPAPDVAPPPLAAAPSRPRGRIPRARPAAPSTRAAVTTEPRFHRCCAALARPVQYPRPASAIACVDPSDASAVFSELPRPRLIMR